MVTITCFFVLQVKMFLRVPKSFFEIHFSKQTIKKNLFQHTFYGIESHRCMETTPSLACANKCVFCWRHHSNPVGTEWKWTMDPPEMIIDGALENHYKMIKQVILKCIYVAVS